MSLLPFTFGPFDYLGGYGGGMGLYNSAAEAPAPPPSEPAEPASPVDRRGTGSMVVSTGWNRIPGYDNAPAGGIGTYLLMRGYPAVAFAYNLCSGPIFAGSRTWEIRKPLGTAKVSDAELAKRKDLLERIFEPLWPNILDGMEALNFGYMTQECVWDRRWGYTIPVEFRSFAPLQAQLYQSNGLFAGFRVGQEDRDARYAFHCVCDPHLASLPLLGRPRAENARQDWWRALQTDLDIDRLSNKQSGIQLLLQIAGGATFDDKTGTPVDPDTATKGMASAMEQGHTVAVRSMMFDRQAIEKDPKLADIPLIKAQAFDWGNTGPSMEAALKRLTQKHEAIVTAYHRPVREAMQGSHGTLAESQVQGQVGVLDSEKIHAWLLIQFNQQVVNRVLTTNFGPDAVDTVYARPSPLSDATLAFKHAIAQTLAANRQTGLEFLQHLAFRTLAEQVELPVLPSVDVAANRDAVSKAIAENQTQWGAGQPPKQPAATGINSRMNAITGGTASGSGNGHAAGE